MGSIADAGQLAPHHRLREPPVLTSGQLLSSFRFARLLPIDAPLIGLIDLQVQVALLIARVALLLGGIVLLC